MESPYSTLACTLFSHARGGPSLCVVRQGGTFELVINVPEQYPLQPPSVRYRTRIFHPNVHFKASLE